MPPVLGIIDPARAPPGPTVKVRVQGEHGKAESQHWHIGPEP